MISTRFDSDDKDPVLEQDGLQAEVHFSPWVQIIVAYRTGRIASQQVATAMVDAL